MKFSALRVRSTCFYSWSSVAAFTTFIFSCWKRTWKGSDISLHFLCPCMFPHWRETATCFTVSLPKPVNHQNFLKKVLGLKSCLSLNFTHDVIWSWLWEDSCIWVTQCFFLFVLFFTQLCEIMMTQVFFTSPNGQMEWLICIPNSQTVEWLISWKTAWWVLREEGETFATTRFAIYVCDKMQK